MLKALLWAGTGSFVGGALRYAVYLLIDRVPAPSYHATVWVNLIGCLILGFICGLIDKGFQLNENLRVFLVFGICGGFTTFSTFINDGFKLLRTGATSSSVLYMLISLVGGLLILFLGYFLGGKIAH